MEQEKIIEIVKQKFKEEYEKTAELEWFDCFVTKVVKMTLEEMKDENSK